MNKVRESTAEKLAASCCKHWERDDTKVSSRDQFSISLWFKENEIADFHLFPLGRATGAGLELPKSNGSRLVQKRTAQDLQQLGYCVSTFDNYLSSERSVCHARRQIVSAMTLCTGIILFSDWRKSEFADTLHRVAVCLQIPMLTSKEWERYTKT